MTSPSRCPYYYHTWSNAIPRRCSKEEGHTGEHIEEQLVSAQPNQGITPTTGWIKH